MGGIRNVMMRDAKGNWNKHCTCKSCFAAIPKYYKKKSEATMKIEKAKTIFEREIQKIENEISKVEGKVNEYHAAGKRLVDKYTDTHTEATTEYTDTLRENVYACHAATQKIKDTLIEPLNKVWVDATIKYDNEFPMDDVKDQFRKHCGITF